MNKRIIMMDYAGGHSAWASTRGEIYDERRIGELMRLIRDVGFDTAWFRTSFCGNVCYPSKVMKPFEAEYRLGIGRALRRAMDHFDPLEVSIRAAKRCGLKVLAWITTVDSYYPGIEDPLLARHPEWLVQHRDGQYGMRGIPCYAYPEYADVRVEEVREVMDYGCDGVFHSWATHTICTVVDGDPPDVPNSFGWNPPVLERYHQKHGQPKSRDDYDYNLIADIHGDYVDDLVQRCGEAIHKRGGEYVTSNAGGVLTSDDYSFFFYRPAGAKVFWLPLHWRKWVEQKWIDRIVAGADGPWLAENEKIAPTKVPMVGMMHAAWDGDPNHPEMGDVADEQFATRVERCLRGPLGAVAIQESDSIEASAPRLWDVLRRVFARCP